MSVTHYTQQIFRIMLGLYALLGMHFFMHNQGGYGLYLPFNMVGWVFVSVLIGIGIWHLTLIKQLTFSRTQIWFLAGFAILLLPFLNPQAEWNAQAQPRFLAIAAGLLLFFALSQFQFTEQQRHGLLYLLLGAVAVEVVYGLVQFFVLRDGNWFGYNVKVNRPYGIFQKDTVFSSFMAVGIALSFYLQRWDISFDSSKWKKLLIYFILFSATFLLVHIQSRAGAYGGILVALVFFPILWMFNKRFFWSSFLIVSFSLFFAWIFFHSARGETESYYMNAFYRIVYWKQVLKMFSDAPILGYGYGGFEYNFLHAYRALGVPSVDYDPIGNALDHPHNEVMFWLLEGGLVAVTGLMVFATGYIRSLLKCAGWAKRISLLALVLPLLFHAMVEYPFYHSVAHFFLFIVFLWLADAESGQQKVYACQYWFLARVVAIIIPLIVVPFMLTGLQAAYVLTKYDRMKDKNPQMLEQIVNPLPWMMMYEFQMRSVQLTFSAAMHDKAGLESYVAWAKEFLHNTPRAVVYGRLAYVLQLLNDKEQAQFWLDEGKRLFPRDEFLQKMSLSSGPVVSGAK
ncbi:MAG: ligase [Bacilli bacterium]|nr:ligase [Bacilli bacterium]